MIKKRVGKKKTSWYLCYYDDQGKQIWKSFDTQKEAKAYEGKVLVAKKENRYHEVFDVKKETRISFNELADKYVAIHRDQKCFKGFKDYMIRELREEFGERKLSQIGYMDLELWVQDRKNTPTRSGKPRAAASVNAEVAVFGHMMSKATEWGLLENSPFKKGKRLMLKVDNERIRFLEEEQIETLLQECPSHLRPIVEVALLTGMRRGELLGLKWDQIRNGSIYLEGGMCKSGKGREIAINDQLDEVFRDLRRANQLKSEYVFCDTQGKRFYEVKRSFTGACRRAGIEDFRFHDLRHTFASRLVMRGASIKVVQELLGHADLTMTMRYSHLSQEHKKKAVDLLNDTPGIGKTWKKIQTSKKADNPKVANLL
jgi:integrase